MTKKNCDILVGILARQKAQCAKLSNEAGERGEMVSKAFQAGASLALERALEYVKDARAGILTE